MATVCAQGWFRNSATYCRLLRVEHKDQAVETSLKAVLLHTYEARKRTAVSEHKQTAIDR